MPGVSLVGLKNNNGDPLIGGRSNNKVLINPNSAPNGEETPIFFSNRR